MIEEGEKGGRGEIRRRGGMGERETGGMGNLEGGCDKGREKRERGEGGRKKERGWECVIRGGRRREERGGREKERGGRERKEEWERGE